MNKLTFRVEGTPQQTGSKKSFVIPGTNRASITDQNTKAKPWMTTVKLAALEALAGDTQPLFGGPVELSIVFVFARPKSHWRTGKNWRELKATAPFYHTSKPDLTKLIRCLEDALTGVVWRDDSQVCCQGSMCKRYTAIGETEHAEVTIRELEPTAELGMVTKCTTHS